MRMVKLNDYIKLSLDEARMLVLGAQILLGFEYRTFLESGFDKLPVLSQHLRIMSLSLILLTMLLLMWPASFQQIVEDGEATKSVQQFTTSVMCWALLPFAVALGLDIYTVVEKVTGYAAGIAGGGAAAASALFAWYVWEYIQRRRIGNREHVMHQHDQTESGGTKLFDMINYILTEARVVIPGAQALLGFQLIAVMTDGFDKLASSSKYVHLASLGLIAASTILLMTPAAYHRIVEQGEISQRLWRHSRRMLMSGMA